MSFFKTIALSFADFALTLAEQSILEAGLRQMRDAESYAARCLANSKDYTYKSEEYVKDRQRDARFIAGVRDRILSRAATTIKIDPPPVDSFQSFLNGTDGVDIETSALSFLGGELIRNGRQSTSEEVDAAAERARKLSERLRIAALDRRKVA